MAAFNPQVPNEEAPNFLGLSKGIGPVKGNTAIGGALKNVGSLLKEGVEAGDTYVKDTIEDTERAKVQPIMDEHLAQLEQADNIPQTKPSLLESQPSPPPTAVSNAIKTGERLTAARDNGVLTETPYLAKLNRVLYDVRGQYPAYRDYVDKTMSKITGKDVANDYVNSVRSDINASQAAAKAESEKTYTQIRRLQDEGIHGSDDLETDLRSGKIDERTAKHRIVELNAISGDIKLRRSQLELANLERENQKYAAGDLAFTVIQAAAHSYQENISLGTEADRNTLSRIQAGEHPEPEQVRSLLRAIQVNKDKASRAIDMDMSDPKKGLNGRSFATILDPAVLESHKKQQLAFFDEQASNLTAGDYGAINYADNLRKDMTSRDKLALFQNTELGPVLRLDAASKSESPQFNKIINDVLMSKGAGGTPGLNAAIATQVKEFATGTSVISKGTPSLSQSVDMLNNEPKLSPGDKAKSINELVSWIERIASKDTPDNIKKRFIDAAYNPENNGLIAKFEANDKQLSIFGRMTSPELLHAAHLMGQDSWDKVKNWTEQTFGRDIFQRDLEVFQATQSRSAATGDSILWDSERHQFIQGYARHQTVSSDVLQRRQSVDALLKRINYGLYNISSLAKESGTDVNAYLLKVMQTFNALNPDKVQGLPQAMYDAVTNQRAVEDAARKKQEENYKKRKQE